MLNGIHSVKPNVVNCQIVIYNINLKFPHMPFWINFWHLANSKQFWVKLLLKNDKRIFNFTTMCSTFIGCLSIRLAKKIIYVMELTFQNCDYVMRWRNVEKYQQHRYGPVCSVHDHVRIPFPVKPRRSYFSRPNRQKGGHSFFPIGHGLPKLYPGSHPVTPKGPLAHSFGCHGSTCKAGR